MRKIPREILKNLWLIPALAGASALAGWIFNVEFLKSIFFGMVSMKPNTAVAFIFSGIAMRISPQNQTLRARKLMIAVAAVIALLGTSALFEYISDIDLGIDQLLFREDANPAHTSHAGRMAPATAFGFMSAGIAFFIETRKLKYFWLQQSFAAGILLLILSWFMGYLYLVKSMYSVFNYTPMAVHTVIAFTAIGIGLLFQYPNKGFVKYIYDKEPAGIIAKRLLAVCLLIIFTTGLLFARGTISGFYSNSAGFAFFALSNIFLMTLSIYYFTKKTNQLNDERAKLADELFANEHRFQSIMDNSMTLISVKDAGGHYLMANRTFEKLRNISAERIKGMTDHAMFPKDIADKLVKNDEAVLKTGVHAEFEETIQTAKELRTYLSHKFPLSDAIGCPHAVGAISMDITERKRNEEEKQVLIKDLETTNSLLTTANKELETFSYSVSHDLRAPLRAIDGYSKMLTEDHAGKLDAEAMRLLNVIRRNTQKMGQLIDNLLDFSRMGRKEMENSAVDMTKLAQSAYSQINEKTPADCKILDMPRTYGDMVMLKQVFLNLLSNAVKYSRHKSDPEIEAGGKKEDGYNLYWVKDNGAGFDMKFVHKLFMVFERLHSQEEFEGTGVGLAIVQKIIQRHGGEVWAESKVNEGAVFYFKLPIRSETVEGKR